MSYTLSQIIKDCQISCDVLNELINLVNTNNEVLIVDPIHKLVLYKMFNVLPELNLVYKNNILKRI